MAIKTTTSSTDSPGYIDKIEKGNVDTNDLTFSCGGVTVFQHPAQLTMYITTPSGITAQTAIHSISISRTNSQEPFLVANGLTFNGEVIIGPSGASEAVVVAPQNNFSNPQDYLFVGDEVKITANLNSGY